MYESSFQPKGPFDLLHQNEFFNGWPRRADGRTIVMAFPVEREWGSAAVEVKQNADTSVSLTVHGSGTAAATQALAALSLDVDATAWPAVGERDPRLGALQEKFRWLRPSLFHSPYEAAAAFVIGHRNSIAQTRRIRARLSVDLGEEFSIDAERFHAFPSPQRLLQLDTGPGLNATKIERLHAVAQAALDGRLDRALLREREEADALARLQTLPGIGPFFAQGILHRGAGSSDGMTHDDMTREAFGAMYGLGDSPSRDQVFAVAERHRPFRMWAVVLLHVWLRQRRRP